MIMLTFDATIFDEVTGTHLVRGLNFFIFAAGGADIAFCFLLFCAAHDILYTPLEREWNEEHISKIIHLLDSVGAHQWLQLAKSFMREERDLLSSLYVGINIIFGAVLHRLSESRKQP